MPATATPDQVQEKLFSALQTLGTEPDLLAPEATLAELEIDSLDLVEVAQILEDEYGVKLSSQDLQNVSSLGDVIDLVVERAE